MPCHGEEIQGKGRVGTREREERICGEREGGGEEIQPYFDLILSRMKLSIELLT